MATPVVGESQVVAVNAIKEKRDIEFDANIMRLCRWIACLLIQAVFCGQSLRAPEDAHGQSSLRDL